MLKGEIISLRTVSEADLERLYAFHQEVGNRGDYYPLGVMAEPIFKRRYAETGFWQKNEGMLLIVNATDEILGHIEFSRTMGYLDELELDYLIYGAGERGKGVGTEALRLMTGYLFDHKQHNRIRLMIHPENAASKRMAEKCGYRCEGTARGIWFHRGRSQDMEVYAIIRADYYGANAAQDGDREGE